MVRIRLPRAESPAPSAILKLTDCKENSFMRSSGYRSFRDTRKGYTDGSPHALHPAMEGELSFPPTRPRSSQADQRETRMGRRVGHERQSRGQPARGPSYRRTDQIIIDAERGDYPPLPHDRIEPIACDWWRWFGQERAKLLNVGAGLVSNGLDPHLWALTGEKELTDLFARFVAENGLDYRPGSGPFDRIKQRCKEIHHETAYGYRSEIDDRMAAANQIWDAADDQLSALKNGVPLEGRPPQAVNRPPNLAAIGTPYKFSTLITEWARERKAQDKTKYGFDKIVTKLSKHLGHDDAAAVTDTDLISWKESLIESDLSPKTIKNHLLVVKTLFKFAKANKKIATNVAAEVSYQARTDPREKRLGYSDEDARRILIAARGETEPHLRWVPWLACFTGCPPRGTGWCYGPRRGDNRGGSLSTHPARLPPETSITEK